MDEVVTSIVQGAELSSRPAKKPQKEPEVELKLLKGLPSNKPQKVNVLLYVLKVKIASFETVSLKDSIRGRCNCNCKNVVLSADVFTL